MALYFCNPMTLMGGEILCSPYRNMQQTDSRTGLFHLGEKKRPQHALEGVTSPPTLFSFVTKNDHDLPRMRRL